MLSSDKRNRSKPAARGGAILASHTAASRLLQQRNVAATRDRFSGNAAVRSEAPAALLSAFFAGGCRRLGCVAKTTGDY